MAGAVIIIPSQGQDVAAFAEVAQQLNGAVYGQQATILRTTVTPRGEGAFDVVFTTSQGRGFSWQALHNLSTVLTLSHGGPLDGPNLAYLAGGYQPWAQLTPKDLEKQGIAATESVLTETAKQFWQGVGQALAVTGKIILGGCGMGTRDYAQAVAKATGRKVYAAIGTFGAGDTRVAIPAIRAIENGEAHAPMQLFSP